MGNAGTMLQIRSNQLNYNPAFMRRMAAANQKRENTTYLMSVLQIFLQNNIVFDRSVIHALFTDNSTTRRLFLSLTYSGAQTIANNIISGVQTTKSEGKKFSISIDGYPIDFYCDEMQNNGDSVSFPLIKVSLPEEKAPTPGKTDQTREFFYLRVQENPLPPGKFEAKWTTSTSDAFQAQVLCFVPSDLRKDEYDKVLRRVGLYEQEGTLLENPNPNPPRLTAFAGLRANDAERICKNGLNASDPTWSFGVVPLHAYYEHTLFPSGKALIEPTGGGRPVIVRITFEQPYDGNKLYSLTFDAFSLATLDRPADQDLYVSGPVLAHESDLNINADGTGSPVYTNNWIGEFTGVIATGERQYADFCFVGMK